jgi:hypothetical protein
VHRVKSTLLVSCPEPLQAYLGTHLEPAGWICVACPGVREARRLLHEVRPAIVLVCAEDPTERARALQRLRADPLVAGVPVLPIVRGRPVADDHWIGARLDALRADAARQVYAELEALLASPVADASGRTATPCCATEP